MSSITAFDTTTPDPTGTTPPTTPGSGLASSWFEALAQAWGQALDAEAETITTLSSAIGAGGVEDPSQIALLTAESQKMSFLSNSESTSINSVGQALDAVARKQ